MQMLRAVAREGSLSAAARALGYTQPAVSHHIARLEEEVGTALLTRLGRGVQLTDAGARPRRPRRRRARPARRREEEVAAIAGLRAGRVRIAAFPSGCATLMAGALSRLRAAHPGVEVAFMEAEPPEALPLLRAARPMSCSASATPRSGTGTRATSRRSRCCTTPRTRSCRSRIPRPGGGPVELEALAGETWIAGCERCRAHLLHATGEAGFAPRIDFATDDHLTVQSLIAGGLGVSLLPALALCSARRDDVAVLPVAGEPGPHGRDRAARPDRRPPAVLAAIAALRAAAEDLERTEAAAGLGLRVLAADNRRAA